MFYSGRHLIFFDGKNREFNIDIDLSHSHDLKKELEVRLTNDDDLCFLYYSRINIDEFSKIKQQQGLLVNFNDFEQKVVELLNVCSQDESTENPKYAVRFSKNSEETNSGVLQIVEATNFKYLHHLTLNLRAADDDKLKAYLVGCIKKHKSESNAQIHQLNQSLTELTSSLRSVEEAKRSILDDFEKYKECCSNKEANILAKHDLDIKEMESNHAEVRSKLEVLLSKEKDMAREMQEEMRRDFESRLDLALSNNKNLRDHQSVLQTSLEELQEKLKLSEAENASLNKELKDLRSQLDDTKRTYDLQTEMVNQLQSNISVLEQDVASKDKQLVELKNSLATEEEQKSHALEQSEHQSRNIQSLEKMLSSNTEEINKSNEIIKRLQNEVKSFQTKAKLRGQVAAEQERLLVAKDSEIQKLNVELEGIKSELSDITKRNAHIVEEHRQVVQNLTDAQKTIKSNEAIIAWLNRQIAENDLGYVQSRLKSSICPVISEPNTSNVSSTVTSANAMVASSGNERYSACKGTHLSNIPQIKPQLSVMTQLVTCTSPIMVSSLNANIVTSADKKYSEVTTNSCVKNLSCRMNDKNYVTCGLNPLSTAKNHTNPRTAGDFLDPTSTSVRPSELANCINKSQNVEKEASSKYSCTNYEDIHQQSLASAYFPQTFS
ncbi:unnamed protein product [Trichobilharzia szidati]|nr:unnamed protein product [Trichobilharzia szidati]